jgi:hypothetical protein
MPLHTQAPADSADDEVSIRPELAQPGELHSVPRFRLAERMLPAQTAYQLIHDELLLDASSRLNLATFIGTWMEPQARVLIEECAGHVGLVQVRVGGRAGQDRGDPHVTAADLRRDVPPEVLPGHDPHHPGNRQGCELPHPARAPAATPRTTRIRGVAPAITGCFSRRAAGRR